MNAESIAKCSPWSILQYFWPALSDNRSWKPFFVFLRVVVLHRFYFSLKLLSDRRLIYCLKFSSFLFTLVMLNIFMYYTPPQFLYCGPAAFQLQTKWNTVWILIRWLSEASWSWSSVVSKKDKSGFSKTRVNLNMFWKCVPVTEYL